MALRFLGKTSLLGLEPLQQGGSPVLSGHSRLRDTLRQRLGSEAADLLAEPIVTWAAPGGSEGSVSWYADVAGEPIALAAAVPERRRMLEARLRQVLAGMAALFDDPTIGPLLLRALLIASPEGIRAIGDSVVLTDWGLAPVGNSLPAEPLAALAASPLGPFLPAPAPHAAPAAAPGAAAPRPAAAAAAAAPIAFAPAAPTTKSPWNWWLLPIVLVIAAFCLALGVWRGQQIVAAALLGRPNTVQLFDEAAARRALAQQNEENAALEHEIEERRHALAGNVCQMDPAQVPRLGADRRAAPPAGAVPQLPGAPPFQGNLADLLKQALVLVVVPQTGDSVVLGSGFFVTADMIATNRHVVEKAIDGKILVTNELLGHLAAVELVAESDNSDIGALDVALLRLNGAHTAQPLAMTTTVAQLDQVIAAGYPGLTIGADAAFKRLQEGDMSATPALILTDGRISAIQDSDHGLKIMPHTASISGGNSGGPLVDGCGRVVGINTYIRSDVDSASHNNYALKSDAIIPFLKAHGAAVDEVSGPCTPTSPAAPPPAAAPQAAAPQPPPPPAAGRPPPTPATAPAP